MWVWDTISKCWLWYWSFWKVFDITYTTSISKCFDIGCDIQFQCTSISKLLSFRVDIEVLRYRVQYSIKVLRYRSIQISMSSALANQISISKYIHFDIKALRFWHAISKHAASISKKLRYRRFFGRFDIKVLDFSVVYRSAEETSISKYFEVLRLGYRRILRYRGWKGFSLRCATTF